MRTYVLDARTVTPHFPGIGRYVRSLAAALPGLLAQDERLKIIRPTGTNFDFPEEPSEQVSFIDTDVTPFGLRQQRNIPGLLRSADVYHSPYYLMPYRPAAPTVLTIYDLIPLRYPELMPLRVRLTFRITTRLALAAARQVICISSATRKDLLDTFAGLDPENVHAIPLAPAAQFFPRTAEETAHIRQKYHLPDEFGLYLGINKPHKNLVHLVEAWSQADTIMPLVISGAWDSAFPEARETAERLGLTVSGRVRFIGAVPEADLPGLYTACRLFVFPSLYEGFGLPVIEALACGAQVACSNTSSLPEVAGDAAELFDPAIPLSIAQGIETALAAPHKREIALAQAGKFNWTHTAAATLEIYRGIAYNSRQSP